jgi:16S rRNA (adenine1518-N6/adenine1519-N6)-dimethyltransferase
VKQTHPFRPTKKLGQHFLRDPSIARQIILRAGFDPDSWIMEIGPGMGALTFPLAESVRHVMAVEKDPRLAELLRSRLLQRSITNVTLVNRDVLRFHFEEVAPSFGGNIQVIGNLPFNISSPFLEKLMNSRAIVTRAVLTFQAELGKRLIASPGNKQYGAMSVLAQYYARVSPLLEIPRKAFYPSPKVESMVVELDFTRPHPVRAQNEDVFRRVVKGAFSHRRKTLINSLRGAFPEWDRDDLLRALKNSRIDPGNRAEVLEINDFIRLSKVLVCFFDNKRKKD